MSTKKELKEALASLIDEGKELTSAFSKGEEQFPVVLASYQRWYTKALPLVRLLAADRADEFESYYRTDPKRKKLDILTYSIQDYLAGLRPVADFRGHLPYDATAAATSRAQSQYFLLSSLGSRIEGAFADVEAKLAAEFEDRELAIAKALMSVSLRAAGAVAGVALESHLSRVCSKRQITTRKKSPGISDYNDLLKRNDVIDTPTWRRIQYLGDIRNVCSHKKERDPTREEVEALIKGVNEVTKVLF